MALHIPCQKYLFLLKQDFIISEGIFCLGNVKSSDTFSSLVAIKNSQGGGSMPDRGITAASTTEPCHAVVVVCYQQCMNIVTDELDKCRRLFWLAMQCVCLDNQYVKLMNGEIHVAKANTIGAKRVQSAKYNVRNKSVIFVAGNVEYTGKCP